MEFDAKKRSSLQAREQLVGGKKQLDAGEKTIRRKNREKP